MKKTIIIIIFALLIIGGWYFYSQSQQEVNEGQNEVNNTAGEEANETTPLEDESVEEAEEDPYQAAEIVTPVNERNIVMHEDFSTVLGEVFEKGPKLTSSGNILVLSYVTDRAITSDDVTEIIELLEERGYILEGTDVSEDVYDLNFSAKILEEEYNGNIYMLTSTAEEGEKAQKIEIRIL